MSSNTNDLSTSLGALVGMMMGGPGGAVAGSMVGNLMSGGTFQSAMESGIGSLVTSGLGGKAGLAMNLLGNMGGASPQQRGSNFLDMFSNMQGSAPRPMQRQPMTAMTSMFNPLQTAAPSSGGTAMGGIGNLPEETFNLKNSCLSLIASYSLNSLYVLSGIPSDSIK